MTNGSLPTGLFDRVNYITDLWADPCDAPFTVYVETAFPHALELFISATTFGGADLYSQASGFMEEVIEGVADPGGPNLSRRGLRGARKGRFRNKLLDLPDRVANRSTFAEVLRPLTDNTAGRSFFFFYNFADRALFQWFIANKAANEFIDFTTALYQTRHCSQAAAPRTGATFPGAGNIPISGWETIYIGSDDYAENGANIASGSCYLGGPPGRLIASNTMYVPDNPITYKLRAVGHRVGPIHTVTTTAQPGQQVTLNISAQMPAEEYVWVENWVDGDITEGVDGFIKASGANAAFGQEFGEEWFGESL